MLIKTIHSWDIPERMVTPEDIYMNRRQFIAAISAATIMGAATPALAQEKDADPSAHLYPAAAHPAFIDAGRDVTPERINTTYNNFYEFGTGKSISRIAERLEIRPWEIMIDGEVEKPFTIGFDDLLKKVTLEERVYRHRCVEAWSMVAPWTGFPVRKLVELAKPLSSAKYLRMETFNNPEMAPGQRPGLFGSSLPWPYVEGITIAEATNDLAFFVTGAYGKPVAKSMGAPIRLHLPWKYGFKSIKSIVRISFTSERPVSFWEQLQKNEYGFWANVNPEVSHPRWSQATERVLGTNDRIPTVIYNGYGELVADMYKDIEGERLFV